MASMITGFWKNISFYCSRHPDEILTLKQGPYSAYYGCPHEYDEDEPCHNRLNLIDAEKFVQLLMNMITSSTEFDEIPDLTNYQVTKNGIHFKVLKHDVLNERFKVLVDNKKIMTNIQS